MNRKRLEYLAREILPYVKRSRFNMGWWVDNPEHPCKTAACAFGHMAISPKGIRDGITLTHEGIPIFENNHDVWAAASYFNLMSVDARWLFTDDYEDYNLFSFRDITPLMVADRIEILLAVES